MYIPGNDSGATPITVKSVPFKRIGPADDGGIARELALPEVRPEHRDGIAAGDDVFVVPETAPQPRLHAEHAEVVAGDQHLRPGRRGVARELGAEADGHQAERWRSRRRSSSCGRGCPGTRDRRKSRSCCRGKCSPA